MSVFTQKYKKLGFSNLFHYLSFPSFAALTESVQGLTSQVDIP
jgi:hypothetical protein